MDPLVKDTTNYLRDAGMVGILAFILVIMIYSGFKRWWVWGWQYDECCKDRGDLRVMLAQMEAQWADAVRVSRRLQELHDPKEGC